MVLLYDCADMLWVLKSGKDTYTDCDTAVT